MAIHGDEQRWSASVLLQRRGQALSSCATRSGDGRGTGDSQTLGLLQSLEARDDLAARLEEEFDREVLELAMLRVAQRVETHTWRAFQLLALQGLPGADVAAALAMPVGMVYVAKSRVQKLIRQEIQQLERRP